MIEDTKLRELFKAESEEHLQRLDDALLQLETTPADPALLEEAFREAHSLKGAARMLGLNGIQAPAHRLEEQLNAARQGTPPLDAGAIARMAVELAEIRRRTADALAAGAARERSTAAAQAGGAGTTAAASAAGAPPSAAAAGPAGVAAPQAGQEAAVAEPNPARATPFHIGSVRVDTGKLDTLMTHAGELTVTRTRLARRLADIDALADLADEWACSAPRRTGDGAAGTRAAAGRPAHMAELLGQLRAGFAEDSARLAAVAGELETGIRLIRLLPLSNVFRLFPRMVHDLGREHGKEVEFLIDGDETSADKRILEEIKDPLMHMLRNAVDHGIEPPQEREALGKPRTGTVRISASQASGSVTIEVSDDGRGLDEDAIRRAAAQRGLASEEALASMSPAQVQALIFGAGVSTAGQVTEVSGRGVGMGVVRTNVARLKGSIELRSARGLGTRITIRLPVTLATVRVLIVEVNGHPYGLPIECVQTLKTVARDDMFAVEGRTAVLHQGRPVSAARLADLLELRQDAGDRDALTAPASACVVIAAGGEPFAVAVDALLGEQEVMLKPQSGLLERVRNVAGATILDDGGICMVLDPRDLFNSMRTRPPQRLSPDVAARVERKKTILLAEDSIATRTLEARILESAGYQVVTAADGLDAWSKLEARGFDAVVTDVLMPNLDGLGLAARIRREARYAELPIILVTSLASDEDRRRGLEVGANAYLAKSTFDQQVLLDCLRRLT